MKILLVHGRNHNTLAPTELEEQWLAAITRGCVAAGLPEPDRDVFVMPLYGERFDSLLANVDAPLAAAIDELSAADVDAGYVEFRANFFEEIRVGAGITDEQIAAQLKELDVARNPSRIQQAKASLQALDRYMPRLTDGALDTGARDIWAYLTSPLLREEIDRLVGACMDAEPTIVVGHSLGSLIAYSLLRRVHNHTVPRLVTLGSPLGLSCVRSHFRPLKYPDGVQDWFNGYDQRDLIALRGLGPKVFPVEPLVRNDKSVVNESKNCHGALGYLENAAVARAIFLVD